MKNLFSSSVLHSSDTFFQKNYRELISYVEPILSDVISSKSELNRLLAESYYRTGQYSKAIDFNEILSEQKKLILIFILLGNSYFLEKNYLEAIKFLEIVTDTPDSTMQYSSYILGASYLQMKNFITHYKHSRKHHHIHLIWKLKKKHFITI